MQPLDFLKQALPQILQEKLSGNLDVEGKDNQKIWTTLTFAQALDGKVAGHGGRQLILSGKESMLMTHWYVCFRMMTTDLIVFRMRAMHDAILVGINTVINDDPQLNSP
jgi:2,5-diamino-6-(ribosylamino)-4(3H)-pyrimidinone 5'-phosphate reductase